MHLMCKSCEKRNNNVYYIVYKCRIVRHGMVEVFMEARIIENMTENTAHLRRPTRRRNPSVDENTLDQHIFFKKGEFYNRDYTVSDITDAFASAVNDAIEESKQKGLPVARYDIVEKRAYLEHADGTREYVNG